jgi:hypothetical protein
MKTHNILNLLFTFFVVIFIGFSVSAEGKSLDPCSLLSPAEIQEVMNKPVKPGTLKTNANPMAGADCTFMVSDIGSLNILIKPLQTGETAERLKTAFAKMKMVPADVTGLGDSAFFTSPGMEMVQLHVLYGKHYILFTIMVPGMKEIEIRPLAEKLMRTALTRIK